MAASSLIKFTQNAVTGANGQAISGVISLAVTVENVSNTGVASWEIELLDVPSGSALTLGLLAHNDNSATPTTTFTPDAKGGCYRIALRVWDVINRVGTATDTDIRNVVVLDASGFASPPSQIWPLPLPPTASGAPGNKPNELNLGGQERGYAGAGTDGLLDHRFKNPAGVRGISAGTTSAGNGTVVFSNSNGISFGLNGSTLTGSYTVPSTAGLISSVNLSAGTTSNNLTAFVFSNSNNVSFGLNGSTVTATITVPAQTNQTVGLYALGNTTQNSSTTLDARTLSFNGLGAATVGYSNGSIQVSVPVQTAQTQSNVQAIYDGANSISTGTIRFTNANGVSFSVNGQTISGSVAAQTAQTVGLYALGNTTQNSSTTLDARTLSFNGLGAATVGYSNGSIQVSVPTQTVQTQSLIAGIYDGANSISTGTIRFTNANGVSFSINGQTLSGSVASQTNQSLGFYAVSNTTQNSSTTLDARTLSFQGAGIASVGYSNGSIIVSVPAGAPSPVNFSAGTTSGNLGSVVFSNSNGVSFGLNGATLTASVAGAQSNQTLGFYAVGNTTQNSSTTLDARTVSFNGLGAVTAGFSNGSIQVSAPNISSLSGVGGISIATNGSTISISGPTIADYEPFIFSGTTTYAPVIGSLYFQPFELPANITGGRLNRFVSFGNFASNGGILVATNSASFGSASTGSRSVSFSYGNTVGLYSRGAGTNSTRLESFWSNSFSVGIAHSVSVSTNGATTLAATNAATMSYVVSINAAGGYTTTSLASSSSRTTASAALNTSALTAGVSSLANILSGKWIMPVGVNTTINPGNYWLAQVYTTASTTGGTSLQVFSFVNQIALSVAAQDTAYHVWGATTQNANSQIFPGAGAYSAVTSQLPATVAFSDVRSYGTNLSQYFNVINSTI